MAEKVTIAGLQADLAAMTEEREALAEQLREANETGDAKGRLLTTAEALAKEQAATIARLDAENRQLSGSLRAYKGSATKARAEVLVLKAARSPEARNVGPIFGAAPPSDAERHRAEVRFAAALRAGPTTLVFSDGRREIRELAPLIVDGGAWRSSARGHVLNHQPLLEPGDMTKPEVRIAGFGLLDEAGEQIAWQELVEPITVPRNGRVQLPPGTVRFSF